MAENHDEHAESSQQWEDQTVYGPSTVIAALDRIEDLLEAARAVPLSASVMVNRAEVLDLLDQAREALPDDLKAADAVVADADAVLVRADSAAETTIAEANARARSTIDEAREKADQLVAEAEEHAQKTREKAEEDVKRVREQAEADAENTLADANAQAERLVSGENIKQMAEERAREIVTQARAAEKQMRTGADEYAASSLGSTRDYHLTWQVPDDLGTSVMRVAPGTELPIDVTITSVDDGVLVRAHTDVDIDGECVRCLDELTRHHSVDVDELFFEPKAAQRLRSEEDEEAEDFPTISARDTIDIEGIVRDGIVTLMEDRPLCKPDCQGLCPGCGEKWEDLPEDHEHVVIDPRLAGLSGLLDQLTARDEN